MVYPRDKYWVQSFSASSLIWIMGQSAPFASFHDTKLGGAADRPRGYADRRKDLNRLKKMIQ